MFYRDLFPSEMCLEKKQSACCVVIWDFMLLNDFHRVTVNHKKYISQ